MQVGANRGQISSDKWWEGAFDTALHVINHEVRPDLLGLPSRLSHRQLTLHCLQDSSSDSDSDVSTADEVTVAVVRNSDGTITSASQHELQIVAELAAQPAWFGGGRFGGREGKLARIRQQEALAAAQLGLALPKAELAPTTGLPKASKKRKAPHTSSADASSPAAEPVDATVVKHRRSKKRKDKQAAVEQQAASSSQPELAISDLNPDVQPAGKKLIVVEPAFTATIPAVPFVQTPASGWWGAKKFISAGVMEGMDQPQSKSQSERQQFDEDDQTNLYMAAQNLKTSGKKGLGTKSQIGRHCDCVIYSV